MLIQNRYDGFFGELYAIRDNKPKETEITWLVRKAEEEGSSVCELACGAGRLTIPLAERGFEVVGMDLSETLIDIANHRLKSLPAEVAQRARFVQGDLRQFDLGQRFPFIFIFFGGFEHLTEPTEHRSSLRCIRKHLEPDGLLEIEFMTPSGPKEYFEKPRIVDKKRGRIESLDIDYTERTTLWWLDAKRYCWKTRIWVRHDDGREEYHECQSVNWAFTLEEIPDLMSECGFKVEQILGAHEYPLRPPSSENSSWIVDARPA
ncbi:class I SAM-dependent methyltransferase [bacterium]|nr:class I SAM-dependent methyltransferase [bacterium]